jgi:hypothetical protein
LATYSIDHYKTLLFVHDAVEAIVEPAKYLETNLGMRTDARQQNGPKRNTMPLRLTASLGDCGLRRR